MTKNMTEEKKLAGKRRTNLQAWMDKNNLSGSDLARRLGVQRAYTSLLFNPDRSFGEKAARSIEDKLVLPVGYLDSDDDTPLAVKEWGAPKDLPAETYAMVSRIGLSNEQEDGPALIFLREWLNQKKVTSQGNLRVLIVIGDSMANYLNDGDSVMIDLGQTQIQDSQVYAIRYGSEVRIRRLSSRYDGGLIIRSDNPRYTEEALDPKEAKHVKILGKVLWRAG